MFLSARNICQAWDYVRNLDADPKTLDKRVEDGKKKFVGFELPDKTLGVVGLGAIGVEVANAALSLGMKVLGFDPQMTVQRAWQLSSGVEQANSIEDLIARSQFVTVHVPLVDATRNLIGEAQVRKMPRTAVLMNFARGPVVDESAVLKALDEDRLGWLMCVIFPALPTRIIRGSSPCLTSAHRPEKPRTIAPRWSPGTCEISWKTATSAHSVNFPDAIMPRADGFRLAVANANVPNMVGQISTCLAEEGQNIVDLLNKSRGDIAYTLVDVESPVSEETMLKIAAIDGVLSARSLG